MFNTKYYQALFYLASLLFFISPSSAQKSIEGKICDNQKQIVPFAAAGLLNAADSSLQTSTVCDEKGAFIFNEIKNGVYFLKITAAGFKSFYSKHFTHDSLTSLNLDSLTLEPDGVNLNEVSVTTLKKAIEFKNGNIIINVDASPTAAGKSVYDMLMQLPGVMVDGDNITLRGKGGVRFLIDDKLQQLAGSQLTSLLKSINASSVEQIEIINNPPVKYDAAGSGGLINIKTKKVKITGFSGSALYAFSQGFYSNNFAQLSLNYKGKNFSVFSSFNGDYSDYRATNNWHREVTDTAGTTILDQLYVEKTSTRYASYFLGADWNLNKRNTVSFRIEGRPGQQLITRTATTSISNNNLGYSNLRFDFDKPNSWYMQDYTFNYEHLFDTLGAKLNYFVYYSYYPNHFEAEYTNHYLNNEFNDIQPVKIFRSTNELNFGLLSSKLDFEKKLNKNIFLETGAKGSYQEMLSDFVFENRDPASGVYLLDTNFTNRFLYKEQILAAYANMNIQLKKFSFQLGVRGENTTLNAENISSSVKYNRNYFNLFPVISINYSKSDTHQFQLTYNRRINRPDYNNFNPYKSFRSILTAVQGNPNLLPMYNHNFQFVYTYRGFFSNTLEYTLTDNYFLGYNVENKNSKEIIFYNGNLDKTETISYSMFWQKQIYKWWNLSFNTNSYYFFYHGNVGKDAYSAEAFCNVFGTFQQFSVTKSTKLEFNAWFATPWLEGVYHNKSRSSINIGIRQKALNDKLSIAFGVWDLFYKQNSRNYIEYADQKSGAVHKWDSRRVFLELNYSFGKIKVQQKQTKKDNEEKNRFKRG